MTVSGYINLKEIASQYFHNIDLNAAKIQLEI